jgi:hypothetical protein
MEFYSAIRKNAIMTFASKWVDLEEIMVWVISQVQKVKGCKLSLICARWIHRICIHTKPNIIIYTFIYIMFHFIL